MKIHIVRVFCRVFLNRTLTIILLLLYFITCCLILFYNNTILMFGVFICTYHILVHQGSTSNLRNKPKIYHKQIKLLSKSK